MSHFCAILVACIEECEDLSSNQEAMDSLLLPLLPLAKADCPAAYKLCGMVLRRVSNVVQLPISNFINRVLSGGSSSSAPSELEEHIYPLIFELHKVSPVLLLRVIPNVCLQLQVEEEEIRIKTVKLLGQLFSSPYAEYATEFARNFREFLLRVNDISRNIRMEMVSFCEAIMTKKKSHSTKVEGLSY
jgi:sister-chromatid-cohesion protein PDS5